MSRAHYVENVLGVSGSGALSLMAGATVHIYDAGTTTPIAQTIYDSDGGSGTLSNPLTSDANGKVEFWLDTPARVDLAVIKTGFTSQTRTVDVEDTPTQATTADLDTLAGFAAAGGSEGDVATLNAQGKLVPQAPSGVQVETVPIGSAELKALHTGAGKVLVAAPGAGKQIQVCGSIFAKFLPGDTAYSAAGNFRIGYWDGGSHDRWYEYQGFLNGWTGAETAVIAPVTSGNNDLPESEYNCPLVAYASGAYTLGDGTLIVTVPYLILDQRLTARRHVHDPRLLLRHRGTAGDDPVGGRVHPLFSCVVR